MRSTWKQGNGSLEVRFPERKIEYVLVEYEGPQLVTLRDDDRRYLGLSSDVDDKFVRWIHAPISDLEWQSLLLGLVPMRDVFRKPTVWIVDEYHDGTPIRGQEVNGEELDEDSLPTAAALLPTAAREAFAGELPALPARMLRFQQRKKPSRALPLTAMGKGAVAYQRLWTACATSANDQSLAARRSELSKRSQLFAVAPRAASFGIELSPLDPTLFAVVAERIARLIANADNQIELASFFREFPGARAAYDGFLRALQDNDLDMLASWPSGGVFLSGGRSSIVRAAIGRTKTSTDTTFSAQGYFRGFMKGSGEFEFYDPDADMAYRGDVAKALLLSAGGSKVVISDEDLHEVKITERVVTTPDGEDKSDYELVAFAPASETAKDLR